MYQFYKVRTYNQVPGVVKSKLNLKYLFTFFNVFEIKSVFNWELSNGFSNIINLIFFPLHFNFFFKVKS